MNCYIIEDEKPAQDVLLNYINKTPNLNCLGVFESALELPIVLDMVDFIFLDIQLPEINGLDFLNNLNIKTMHDLETQLDNLDTENITHPEIDSCVNKLGNIFLSTAKETVGTRYTVVRKK